MVTRFAIVLGVPVYTFLLAVLWAAYTPVPQ